MSYEGVKKDACVLIKKQEVKKYVKYTTIQEASRI